MMADPGMSPILRLVLDHRRVAQHVTYNLMWYVFTQQDSQQSNQHSTLKVKPEDYDIFIAFSVL
jgi:hypothetical protein